MKKASQKGLCAYCGSTNRRLTTDHVPPKNLFARPRPDDLVTVPACESCHRNTSADDDYFRMKIAMREDVGEHPDADWAWRTGLTSLQRPQARGFARRILADTREVLASTTSGIIIPRIAYDVDLDRLFRVVARIVRGLYFYERKAVLPQTYWVKVENPNTMAGLDPSLLRKFIQTVVEPLFKVKPRTVGRNVFSYRHIVLAEDHGFSGWALMFYGRVPFFSITGPAVPVIGNKIDRWATDAQKRFLL